MGRQARLKRQRKQRRGDQPLIEQWSRIPPEAESGPCRKPDCTLVHCLDPWVSVFELDAGPLVLLTYAVYPESADRVESRLRANSEEVGTIPTGELFRTDPAAHQAATMGLAERLVTRYGPRARVAFLAHIAGSPQIQEKMRKDAGVEVPSA